MVARHLTGLITALLVLAGGGSPAVAQDRDQVGLAIAQACGAVDERTHGVVAGVVRDARSGVTLDGTVVVIRWEVPGEAFPQTAAERTDADGFFLFCQAPGNTTVELWAEVLDVQSEPVRLEVEAGTLSVQPLDIEVSDPDEPGFVTGRILDAGTRGSIANAQIRVRDHDLTTLSNDGGMFYLEELPYGVYVLEVSHLAYESREVPVHVAGGLTQNVAIELSEEAMELEGLTVTVEPRKFYNDMEGLVRRMNLGFGDFMTRTDIEARAVSKLPDLLVGLPGVRLMENGRSLAIRGRQCIPMVFMDGRLYRLDDDLGLNEISTFDIEAVEFYKGTASIPAEFNYSNNLSAGCGAIVVWTRRGR